MTNAHPDSAILVLTPGLNGNDGIAMVSRTALEALRESGNWSHIELWSLAKESFSPKQMGGSITCRTAGGSKLRFLSLALKAAAFGGKSFDTILALHVHQAPVALPILRGQAKFVIFLHGVEVWKRLSRLESIAMRRASLLIANSRYTVERFRTANPHLADLPISLCALGVPPISSAPGLTVPPSSFALIVGRMSREFQYKGHDQLIDIWPEISRRHPGFQLIIAGDGDDRPRLQNKVQSCGLCDSVRFVGKLPDDELIALYRTCSFFVMPSAGEGFGLVFLEAMRAGKACIAGTGAASEVVVDGRTGILVDPHSREQLLNALLSLIENPARAAEMGENGYERFVHEFTAERFADRFCRLLAFTKTGVAQCAG